MNIQMQMVYLMACSFLKIDSFVLSFYLFASFYEYNTHDTRYNTLLFKTFGRFIFI